MAMIAPNVPASTFAGYGIKQADALKRRGFGAYGIRSTIGTPDHGPATIVDLSPLADRVLKRDLEDA